MDLTTTYFANPGRENTAEALRIAAQRARELGIKKVLVASTSGATAVAAIKAFPGLQVFAVSHSHGFKEPETQEFLEENRRFFESRGGTVITVTHSFGGLSRAMRKKFNTHVIGDIVANTLRVFGQGMKVCCEIVLMCADAGFVRTDEQVISIAGSNGGADTVIVCKPVNAQRFFDLKVQEILCKPHF